MSPREKEKRWGRGDYAGGASGYHPVPALLSIYDKGEQDDITDAELEALVNAATG